MIQLRVELRVQLHLNSFYSVIQKIDRAQGLVNIPFFVFFYLFLSFELFLGIYIGRFMCRLETFELNGRRLAKQENKIKKKTKSPSLSLIYKL